MRSVPLAAALSLVAAALVAAPRADAGAPPQMGFEAAPSPAYGSVAVGTSIRRTFTLGNVGGSSTAVMQVALVGSAAFTIASADDECTGHALGPDRTCTIAVTYTPASAGAQDVATLSVTSRKRTSPRASIELTGGAAATCTDGAMRVGGSIPGGFETCDQGSWIARACAPGTHAVQVAPDVVVCDY